MLAFSQFWLSHFFVISNWFLVNFTNLFFSVSEHESCSVTLPLCLIWSDVLYERSPDASYPFYFPQRGSGGRGVAADIEPPLAGMPPRQAPRQAPRAPRAVHAKITIALLPSPIFGTYNSRRTLSFSYWSSCIDLLSAGRVARVEAITCRVEGICCYKRFVSDESFPHRNVF